jgi:hypothetical protein
MSRDSLLNDCFRNSFGNWTSFHGTNRTHWIIQILRFKTFKLNTYDEEDTCSTTDEKHNSVRSCKARFLESANTYLCILLHLHSKRTNWDRLWLASGEYELDWNSSWLYMDGWLCLNKLFNSEFMGVIFTSKNIFSSYPRSLHLLVLEIDVVIVVVAVKCLAPSERNR